MEFYPSVYCISHFIAAAISLFVVILLLAKHRVAGEKYLAMALLAGAWWALWGGFETGVHDLGQKYLFATLQYSGIYSVIPLLLIFSLNYAGFWKTLNWRIACGLWLIPLTMVALAGTNSYHHLIWTGIQTINQETGMYRFMRGPIYWVGVLFNYSVLVVVSVLLLRKTLRSPVKVYHNQAMIVLLGMAPPWLLNILYFFQVGFLNAVDLTPHAFSLSGLIMAVGVLRFRFIDLSPVARSLLFRKLPDGILVMNTQMIITDGNEASERILNYSLSDMIGKSTTTILQGFPSALHNLNSLDSLRLEAIYQLSDGQKHCYEIDGTSFSDPQGNALGYMLRFRDITLRKQIELEEHDQRILAEAMQNIALTITSTFDIRKVMETVADNMFRTIPCLVCSILLQGEDDKLHLTACRGSPDPDLRKWLDEGTISLATIPNFRLMAETGQAMVIPDLSTRPDWIVLDPRVHSWVCAPILIMGEIIGFLSFDHQEAGFYSELHAQRLKAFADLAAIIIKHARMYHENEQLANTDPLTGLSNRRHFFGIAENELIRTRRYGGPLSLLMIDLDHLKEINDQCGHHVGDRAIVEAAHALKSTLRDHDLCARFGGDEFCILLPETDSQGAIDAANRLVLQASNIVLGPSSCVITIGLSVGIATLNDRHLTIDDLLVEADRALYRAKSLGRNQASL